MDKLTIAVEVAGRTFGFNLCKKLEDLVPGRPLRHFWMDHAAKKLYAPFGPTGGNFRAITDLFWHVCRHYGMCDNADNQQVYLQAQLLPVIRTIGAGRIFSDAKLSKAGRSAVIESLERDLRTPVPPARKSPGGTGTGPDTDATAVADPRVTFRDRTADALRLPRATTPEVRSYYAEVERVLFEGVGPLLARDPVAASDEVRARWSKFKTGVGRRRNRPSQKLALDYVSYECKAAFFRCYSVTWVYLRGRLRRQFGLDEREARFLDLWHLEQSAPGDGPEADFHLFAGHVFALHPAASLLIRTPTGRRRLAEYLPAGDPAAFGRFLDAFNLAAWTYACVADEGRESRRLARERPAGDQTWASVDDDHDDHDDNDYDALETHRRDAGRSEAA